MAPEGQEGLGRATGINALDRNPGLRFPRKPAATGQWDATRQYSLVRQWTAQAGTAAVRFSCPRLKEGKLGGPWPAKRHKQKLVQDIICYMGPRVKRRQAWQVPGGELGATEERKIKLNEAHPSRRPGDLQCSRGGAGDRKCMAYLIGSETQTPLVCSQLSER